MTQEQTKLRNYILFINKPYNNVKTGSRIHYIDIGMANVIATELFVAAGDVGLPVEYLAAILAHESRFDPHAINQNKHGALDPSSFERTDYGIAAFNGRYLAQKADPGLSEDALIALAQDPKWAINAYAIHLQGVYNTAIQNSSDMPWLWGAIPKEVPEADRIYWLAALYYNAGGSEAQKELQAGYHRSYPDVIMNNKAEARKFLNQ